MTSISLTAPPIHTARLTPPFIDNARRNSLWRPSATCGMSTISAP